MRIERHPIDASRIEKSYAYALKEFSECLPSARARASSLTFLISACGNIATCGSVVAPGAPEIGRALRVSSQAHAALMAIANAHGASVTVPLGADAPVTYADVKDDGSTVNGRRWLEGFSLATLCRDAASLKILAATSVSMLRASSTKSPEYRYQLIEGLQRWLTKQPGTVQHFMEAMKATDPARPDILDPDFTLHIDVQWMRSLLYAISEESDFGEALSSGVSYHKKYWTRSEELREDWDGFLSFRLLAAAALGFDRKLPFDVDSEYLPMRLVRGEF